ncbi:MAG: oligosaccharide flippase family protein [Bacteroidota bacterium]|nr:oligosaccharide flippase family protein [Bacteroidota bacterium]
MSNPLKKLAGQTVIYGLGTILPRFMNFLLTPLLTYIFQKPVDYGVNSEMYAYIAFLNVIFSYGMETAFFNFSTKKEDKESVFNTALTSIIISSVSFCILLSLFAQPIANWLQYPDKLSYIYWTILILGTEALMAIPFAKLRINNKAKTFAILKAINVFVNVSLHVFFFVFCKNAYEANETGTLASLYDPHIGIGYSFFAGLIANIVSLICLAPVFKEFKFKLNIPLWKEMFSYAWPLLILGLAGMVNETFDRIIIKKLLPEDIGQHAQGVYGACYKIAMLMAIFRQAFTYAAEPFFFNSAKDKDSKKVYAFVMKAFVIFCSFLFLATMMNLPVIKRLMISSPYWEGLAVVPILLLANLFLGIYYNLSIWYKLTGQTKFGAIITLIGAAITLAINFAFVPKYSYMACAWATFAAYGIMMVISYIIGQKYYPVKYNVRAISVFFILAVGLYLISLVWQDLDNKYLKLILNNLLVVLFVFFFYKLEFSNLKKFNKSTGANDQTNKPE